MDPPDAAFPARVQRGEMFIDRFRRDFRLSVVVMFGAIAMLGITPFATQPIRAAHFPAINEGEPTTWSAFWYNFNRGQYGKPSVFDRQVPFVGQLGMYWMYFSWQWFRDMTGEWQRLRSVLAAVCVLRWGWSDWALARVVLVPWTLATAGVLCLARLPDTLVLGVPPLMPWTTGLASVLLVQGRAMCLLLALLLAIRAGSWARGALRARRARPAAMDSHQGPQPRA